jgi:hypothetical protein
MNSVKVVGLVKRFGQVRAVDSVNSAGKEKDGNGLPKLRGLASYDCL